MVAGATVGTILAAAFIVARTERAIFVNERLALKNRLFIPPVLEPRTREGEANFELIVQDGETQIFSDATTKTRGFCGNYLGPTIRARTGDRVRMNVTNRLLEPTTVHWHGMHLPAAMDGGPHQIILPGETWRPYWTIANEAATLWYHPHPLARTGEQVYRGLAGLFVVDDRNSESLGIPKEYGVDDIPLIIQDRKFDGNGQLLYDPDHDRIVSPGMLGDTILVNGTLAPYVEIPAKLIRLRLLNASNARRYNVGFSDNRGFYQIATDGGLLAAPVERSRMVLAPGERAEVLVDLTTVTEPITLMSYAVVDDVLAIVNLIQEILLPDNDENQIFKLVELRPTPARDVGSAIPDSLNTIVRLNVADAVKTRSFTMDGTAGGINGKAMDHRRIDEVVRRGDIEIWKVGSQSPTYHPFHVHGVQFLLLDRDGTPPGAAEQGWKDTVIIGPAETVRLIMRFSDYSDPHLPYMFHCHVLEHEDMGMMGQFVVVDDPINAGPIQSPLLAMPGQGHSD